MATAPDHETARAPDPAMTIPPKVIERYRKLLTLAADDAAAPNERRVAQACADKLAIRWQGIAFVVGRLEAQEQHRAQRAGRTWEPPKPTREEIEAMIPQAVRKVGDFLGIRLVDLTETALDWATKQIQDAADDGHFDLGQGLITDMFRTEMGLIIDETEDEDTGEEVMIIEIEIPVTLWRRVCDTKTGPAKLIHYIDKLDSDVEDVEDTTADDG